MSTFQRSPASTLALVAKVISECYPDLAELAGHERFPLKIDCLDVHADLDANGEPVGPAIKHGGYAVAADIRAQPKAMRALGLGSVLLRFDGDKFAEMDEAHQEALIDHELYHLVPKRENAKEGGGDGAFKRDDLGFPLFGMRLHDVEVGWFVQVAKRRGFDSVEVQQAKAISDKWGQFLWDFAQTAEMPGMRVLEKTAPPPASAPKGRWMIFEQLNPDQQEEAEASFGQRDGEFFVDEAGTVLQGRPIQNASAETDVTGDAQTGGKVAASKGGGAKAKAPKAPRKKK